jgi:hypothetical protein
MRRSRDTSSTKALRRCPASLLAVVALLLGACATEIGSEDLASESDPAEVESQTQAIDSKPRLLAVPTPVQLASRAFPGNLPAGLSAAVRLEM